MNVRVQRNGQSDEIDDSASHVISIDGSVRPLVVECQRAHNRGGTGLKLA